jgi:3-methyladenine DNA glycosylase AlkD
MRALIEAVRTELAARADPVRAPETQRYMKSAMPYYGVPRAGQKEVARAVFAAHPLAGFGAWRDAVLALWHGATHREERYLALDLLGELIEPNRDDRDFFIRKAIGWALRAYAWTDPEAVIAYCDTHALSGLSRREALKNTRAVPAPRGARASASDRLPARGA